MRRKSAILTPFSINKEVCLYSGMMYVNPQQEFGGQISKYPIYVQIRSYVFTCSASDDVPLQKIGMNKKMRELLRVSMVEKVEVELYDNPSDGYLSQMEMDVEIGMSSAEQGNIEIDDKLLAEEIMKVHMYKYMKQGMAYILPFASTILVVTVSQVKGADKNENLRLGSGSKIQFKAQAGGKLKLKSQKMKTMAIFQSNFRIEQMGIGGLDAELTNIFRRAFASRRFPPSVIEKFGIKHVKGILLYGPPGTGKTLIAKQLAKCLKAKELKIVNGPEVFSKYVGESQENIRKLFAGAREDQKMLGDQSPLHIIVFDQIDAICKQRGTVNNGTNAPDLVVNQLLTNIDGVQALNNVIVIGMTNRKDLIDEAVLRPGRFEVHIEVGLPNQHGRSQILSIQTKNLKNNKLLSNDVNMDELASLCKNFTGAQIEGLVKSASAFAMQRQSNLNEFGAKIVVKQGFKVERQDFLKALNQIKPQFGVDEAKFDIFLRGKLLNYGSRFNRIMNLLSASLDVCLKGQIQLNSVLLEGKSGTGKTSIASYFARQCKFSFVKMISPEQFINVSEFNKINDMVKVFQDAYRSNEACIIIDNIERLLEFIDLGPRFSNEVLQTMLILLKRLPKKPNCRLLIVGTTSCMMKLYDTGIPQAFNVRINVPQLNEEEIFNVLSSQLKVEPGLAKQIATMYKKIPIRKLLQAYDLAHGKDITTWKEFYDEFEG